MVNASSTSNPSFIVDVGGAYPYPSHFIAPNFVTMKLSGKDMYDVWETQILCLLKSHEMYGFINGKFPRPAENGKGKEGDKDAWIISDSLVKGWILGSLSDGVAKKVVKRLKGEHKNTDYTAKEVWDELKRSYGPLVPKKVVVAESSSPRNRSFSEIPAEDIEKKTNDRKRIYNSILDGDTRSVIDYSKARDYRPYDKIMNNGNTILHVAVGSSIKNHELLEELLKMTPPEKELQRVVNYDGSTLLHVAAIGGNTEVVDILVKRNPKLLEATDNEGHIPLALSISNMHIKTSQCLFKHMEEHKCRDPFYDESGEELVVLAISCQDFRLAEMIISSCNGLMLEHSGAVLTALAQNFPREFNFWERGWKESFQRFAPDSPFVKKIDDYFAWPCGRQLSKIFRFFFIGLHTLATLFYQFTNVLVHKDATDLLSSVCFFISANYLSSDYQYHTTSTFEAIRRNASTFVRCIVSSFPDAIWSTNEDGHNFIQYSVINRSEKIYSLLYEMSEHKNIYKTIKDSSQNNLLHLAARLAPTNKLNLISGAALQIQRELQWFKEVGRFVCPLCWMQKNSDDETPEMVFTREHKNLVIEGEIWIKKTAESYTITAALITTIVFAAAITVPGGNNQELGIPIFNKNIAFTVFAISDAISLFAAVTSLLMFLSILTARFAEQDFLFKLPTKLIIGLAMLFLATTTMIIAFGATLFLVFGQGNLLMLIPIGALTCFPITSFVTLQFPLIVELIKATYCGGIFVRERHEYFY